MKIRLLKDIDIGGGRVIFSGYYFDAEISDSKMAANLTLDGKQISLLIGRDCEIVSELPREAEREKGKREFYAHAVLELAKANRIARPNAASNEVIGVAIADAKAYLRGVEL